MLGEPGQPGIMGRTLAQLFGHGAKAKFHVSFIEVWDSVGKGGGGLRLLCGLPKPHPRHWPRAGAALQRGDPRPAQPGGVIGVGAGAGPARGPRPRAHRGRRHRGAHHQPRGRHGARPRGQQPPPHGGHFGQPCQQPLPRRAPGEKGHAQYPGSRAPPPSLGALPMASCRSI